MYPRVVSVESWATVENMLVTSAPHRLRQSRWLLLAVLVTALSLLAMHQLSSEHTAVGSPGTRPASDAAGTAQAGTGLHVTVGVPYAVAGAPPLSEHAPAAPRHHQTGAGVPDHHSDAGDCPGCAHHQMMALTCLAALVLLAVGWVLTRPAAWRGVRVRHVVAAPAAGGPQRQRRALSLSELAISRT